MPARRARAPARGSRGRRPAARRPSHLADRRQTLSVSSFFHTGNDIVYVDIADTVATDGPYVFPRSYQRTMWPTKGLCLSGAAPDGFGFSPFDSTYGFPPRPLTDDGIYCVASAPFRPTTGPPLWPRRGSPPCPRYVAAPDYVPPIEQAPIIYQIVLDLQIPAPDAARPPSRPSRRCSSRRWAGRRTGGAAADRQLGGRSERPGWSVECAQPQSRSLDADAMAETVKQTVLTFPQHHQQFHFLYFDNLNAPLPSSLTSSLQTLFDDLAGAPPNDLQPLSWLFNPRRWRPRPVRSWWKKQPWQRCDRTPIWRRRWPPTRRRRCPTPARSTTRTCRAVLHGRSGRHVRRQMFKVCTQNTPVQIVSLTTAPGWAVDRAGRSTARTAGLPGEAADDRDQHAGAQFRPGQRLADLQSARATAPTTRTCRRRAPASCPGRPTASCAVTQ